MHNLHFNRFPTCGTKLFTQSKQKYVFVGSCDIKKYVDFDSFFFINAITITRRYSNYGLLELFLSASVLFFPCENTGAKNFPGHEIPRLVRILANFNVRGSVSISFEFQLEIRHSQFYS